MVSLAVISVGALGYVTSQISSMKNISVTASRTMATLLIYDITARMQANSAEFWRGVTSGYLPAGGTPAAKAYCYDTQGHYCTSTEMALNDVFEWQALVASSFPSGAAVTGLICLDGGVAATVPTATPSCGATNTTYPLTYSIKIFWQSVPGSGSYDQVQQGTVEAPLLRAPTYPLPAPPPNQ